MRRWTYLLLGAIAGAGTTLAGVYFYERPVITFWLQSHYLSSASQGRLDVAVLQRLRADDIAEAINVMEHRLDMHIATLEGYEMAFAESDRDRLIVSGLEAIRDYRKQFPREAASHGANE